MDSERYISHIDHKSCACEACLDRCPFNRESEAWSKWAFGISPFPKPKMIEGLLDWDWEIAVARKTFALESGGVCERPSMD